MLNDPFNQPVDLIQTPAVVDLPTRHEPELFFDGDRFLLYLDENFDSFDVLTYSLSQSVYAPLHRIQRLITNLPLHPGSAIRPRESRVVINNHAKIFLCYSNGVLSCSYIGSQNLTHASQINIMYRADYRHNTALLEFFNSLWSKAYENRNRRHPTPKPSLPNLR